MTPVGLEALHGTGILITECEGSEGCLEQRRRERLLGAGKVYKETAARIHPRYELHRSVVLAIYVDDYASAELWICGYY